MPAFRGKNLRSGDLAEQFGYYMLQTVALVATVPRTEDVGIDLVCTLYEDFDRHKVLAKDSFYLQLKSNSVSEICYTADELQWLRNLKLPFFIGSVNRRNNSISLYATYDVHNALISNSSRNELTISIGKDSLQNSFYDANQNTIGLGKPIIEWNINNTNENGFSKKFYDIVSAHTKLIHNILNTRESGWIENVKWDSNIIPESIGWRSLCSTDDASIIDNIADTIMPHFSMMIDYATKFKSTYWIDQIESICKETKSIINRSK